MDAVLLKLPPELVELMGTGAEAELVQQPPVAPGKRPRRVLHVLDEQERAARRHQQQQQQQQQAPPPPSPTPQPQNTTVRSQRSDAYSERLRTHRQELRRDPFLAQHVLPVDDTAVWPPPAVLEPLLTLLALRTGGVAAERLRAAFRTHRLELEGTGLFPLEDEATPRHLTLAEPSTAPTPRTAPAVAAFERRQVARGPAPTAWTPGARIAAALVAEPPVALQVLDLALQPAQRSRFELLFGTGFDQARAAGRVRPVPQLLDGTVCGMDPIALMRALAAPGAPGKPRRLRVRNGVWVTALEFPDIVVLAYADAPRRHMTPTAATLTPAQQVAFRAALGMDHEDALRTGVLRRAGQYLYPEGAAVVAGTRAVLGAAPGGEVLVAQRYRATANTLLVVHGHRVAEQWPRFVDAEEVLRASLPDETDMDRAMVGRELLPPTPAAAAGPAVAAQDPAAFRRRLVRLFAERGPAGVPTAAGVAAAAEIGCPEPHARRLLRELGTYDAKLKVYVLRPE